MAAALLHGSGLLRDLREVDHKRFGFCLQSNTASSGRVRRTRPAFELTGDTPVWRQFRVTRSFTRREFKYVLLLHEYLQIPRCRLQAESQTLALIHTQKKKRYRVSDSAIFFKVIMVRHLQDTKSIRRPSSVVNPARADPARGEHEEPAPGPLGPLELSNCRLPAPPGSSAHF